MPVPPKRLMHAPFASRVDGVENFEKTYVKPKLGFPFAWWMVDGGWWMEGKKSYRIPVRYMRKDCFFFIFYFYPSSALKKVLVDRADGAFGEELGFV